MYFKHYQVEQKVNPRKSRTKGEEMIMKKIVSIFALILMWFVWKYGDTIPNYFRNQ